jgi:hypothetical protein
LSVAGMETVAETRTIADLVHRNAPLGSKDDFIGFGRRDAKKS